VRAKSCSRSRDSHRGGKLDAVNQGEARKAVLFTALAAVAMATPFACSSPQTLQGNGGRCLQTIECQPGLFCVPQMNGPGMCSTNLMSIVSTEEGGKQEASAAQDGAAKRDAPTPDTGATTPPDGGSTPEAQAPQDGPAAHVEAAGPVPEAGD
jgi:hypothetical protein